MSDGVQSVRFSGLPVPIPVPGLLITYLALQPQGRGTPINAYHTWKKSASWHLIAGGKKCRENDKSTQSKGNFAKTTSVNFCLPAALNFFPGMIHIVQGVP